MVPSNGSDQRKLLLRMQRERLCHGYTVALNGGMLDPVIWLVDQDDKLGRELVLAALDGNARKLSADRARIGKDSIAAHIIAVPRAQSIEMAESMSPTGHLMLRQGPLARHIHVVIVSGGGNSYAAIPLP